MKESVFSCAGKTHTNDSWSYGDKFNSDLRPWGPKRMEGKGVLNFHRQSTNLHQKGKTLSSHCWVSEDWNGGAGNGLGTLYAFVKVEDLGCAGQCNWKMNPFLLTVSFHLCQKKQRWKEDADETFFTSFHSEHSMLVKYNHVPRLAPRGRNSE